MKIFLSMVFALAMIVSVVFIGDAVSSNAPFSINAQTKVERKTKSIAHKTYGRGKWVVIKTKNGTKRVWRASTRTGRKIGQGTKRVTVKTYRKTKHGTKKVFHKVKNAVT